MHSRCKRISMLCEHGDTVCLTKPTSYSYNFITLVSKLSVPPNGRGFFTYKGPSWYENIDFDLKIVHVTAPSYLKAADDQYFRYFLSISFFFIFFYYLHVICETMNGFEPIAFIDQLWAAVVGRFFLMEMIWVYIFYYFLFAACIKCTMRPCSVCCNRLKVHKILN